MNSYKVVISETAEADLNEIADYIAINLQEPRTAAQLIEKIKDAILSLKTMPERHKLVADGYLSARGIRFRPVDNFLLFYSVNRTTETVFIVRVLYGKREWKTLL